MLPGFSEALLGQQIQRGLSAPEAAAAGVWVLSISLETSQFPLEGGPRGQAGGPSVANVEVQVGGCHAPGSALTVLCLSRKCCVSQAPVGREAQAGCLHGDGWSQGQHPAQAPLPVFCGSRVAQQAQSRSPRLSIHSLRC